MKVVVQRVLKASASVDGEVIASIGPGLCLLIGIGRTDTMSDVRYMVDKILNTRIFQDGEKKWNKNVIDMNYELLCLSQVTLYHKYKGTKLDFHHAMSPDKSLELFNNFVSFMRQKYKEEAVKQGQFGAYSIIEISNDGPVTIVVDSPSTADKDKVGDAENN